MDNIFAYEVNGLLAIQIVMIMIIMDGIGFGSRYVMDDANVPVCFSLLPMCYSSNHLTVLVVIAISWLPRQKTPGICCYEEVAAFAWQPILLCRDRIQWCGVSRVQHV